MQVILHPYTVPSLKFAGLGIRKIWRTMCVSINGPGDPDFLTLKLVCESHLKWGTFLTSLGTKCLWVLELFAMYVMDGQTDGRTEKSNAYCPFPMGGCIIKCFQCNSIIRNNSNHSIATTLNSMYPHVLLRWGSKNFYASTFENHGATLHCNYCDFYVYEAMHTRT